jgi:hypothetical protein
VWLLLTFCLAQCWAGYSNGAVKILPIIVATLFLIIGTPPSVQAKSKKKTPTPAADTSDKITAVHLTSITINLYATHAGKEYKVTPATKITVNGQPAQLNGLATGMNVIVTAAPDNPTVAATIDAKTPKR